MDDLAPDLVRQRLIVEGFFTIGVDEKVITQFFSVLTSALALRPYGEPTIFSPGGEGRGENQGFDAVIPLIDSGISLYMWSHRKFLSLVTFSCKRFDVDRAIETTREYFAMTDLVHQQF
jgi:S-adenosylmethionine decarboxylase